MAYERKGNFFHMVAEELVDKGQAVANISPQHYTPAAVERILLTTYDLLVMIEPIKNYIDEELTNFYLITLIG